MPPIITIDTSSSPHCTNAHHSTIKLSTLLHNNKLILVEVQGTLEYNVTDRKDTDDISLGDISWDDTVCKATLYTLTPGI